MMPVDNSNAMSMSNNSSISSSESESSKDNSIRNSYINRNNSGEKNLILREDRIFYHPLTMLPVKPEEADIDSERDEAIDDSWLRKHHHKVFLTMITTILSTIISPASIPYRFTSIFNIQSLKDIPYREFMMKWNEFFYSNR